MSRLLLLLALAAPAVVLSGGDECSSGMVRTVLPGKTSPSCVCAAGKYTLLVVDSSVCIMCQPGQISAQPDAVDCDYCPAGMQPVAGQTSCKAPTTRPTPAPSHAPSAPPTAAPSSLPTASPSSPTCVMCGAGKFYLGETRCKCIKCSPGRFSTTAGRSSCDYCPTGTNTTTAGQSSCRATAAPTKHPTPTVCHAGSFKTPALACRVCPEGTYTDSPGLWTCARCPKGKATAGTGTTSVGGCMPPAANPDDQRAAASAMAVVAVPPTAESTTTAVGGKKVREPTSSPQKARSYYMQETIQKRHQLAALKAELSFAAQAKKQLATNSGSINSGLPPWRTTAAPTPAPTLAPTHAPSPQSFCQNLDGKLVAAGWQGVGPGANWCNRCCCKAGHSVSANSGSVTKVTGQLRCSSNVCGERGNRTGARVLLVRQLGVPLGVNRHQEKGAKQADSLSRLVPQSGGDRGGKIAKQLPSHSLPLVVRTPGWRGVDRRRAAGVDGKRGEEGHGSAWGR